MSATQAYDLAVVGAGIVGMATALAAARRGWRVVVIDREQRAIGASIRNFGFITVTGQQAGPVWRRAMRSRDVWLEICSAATIPIVQHGLFLSARRPQAEAVLEEFLATEMGAGLERISRKDASLRAPRLRADSSRLIVYSPYELRVEAREAIPRLARYLAESHRVEFLWGTAVTGAASGGVQTTRGFVAAPRIAVCPGTDLRTLFPESFERHEVALCKLQMLRLRVPGAHDLRAPVMSDLSFARYLGYAELPAAAQLARQLEAECPGHLAHGIHLIVVQSADGSWVVGDSHHYDASPDPFATTEIDDLILDEMHLMLHADGAEVSERWVGVYPSAPREPCFVDAPQAGIRVVSVTSGTGMSTSFALAEEVVQEWD